MPFSVADIDARAGAHGFPNRLRVYYARRHWSRLLLRSVICYLLRAVVRRYDARRSREC